MSKNKIAILLGCVCLVLTIAISVQIKTVGFVNKNISSSYVEDQLRDEVLRWRENHDRKTEELKQAEKLLEATRKKATENDGYSANIEEKLNLVTRLLGLTAVKGKGIVVVLDDNKTQAAEAQDGGKWQYLIHDGDLREIVNDLKNGGAEAISINSQRVVSTTGIICDGNVVRVNGQKISAPYTIKAIGSPEGLMGSLTFPGAYIEELQTLGLVKILQKENNVDIPKFDGIYSSEYIKIYE